MSTRRRLFPLAILSVPVVAVTVLAGVWVAGGVISDDFRTSMALTAAWFVIAGGACVLAARRWRALAIPVLAAFLLTAGATGAYLAATTLRDRVVHERVIIAGPLPADDASAAGARVRSSSPADASAPTSTPPAAPHASCERPMAAASSR